jgi:hypothetical protein
MSCTSQKGTDDKNLHEGKKKRLDNEQNDESILNMIIGNDDQSKTPLMAAVDAETFVVQTQASYVNH